MRRIFQRARREDDDEVEAHRVPVDLAERCDPGVDLAAEDRDGEIVPDLEPGRLRCLDIERDQRRAGIIGRPPFACDDPAAFRHVARISEAAVAAQEPGALRQLLHIGDALALHRDDRAAQRRYDDEIALRRGLGGQPTEAPNLLDRDVEHEEAGRLGGYGRADLAGKIGLDDCQRREKREAETERHHQTPGLGRRPVQVGQGEAKQRVSGTRQRRGDAPDQPPEQREEQEQAKRRGDEEGRKARLACGRDRQSRDQPGRRSDGEDEQPGRPAERLETTAEQGRGWHGAGTGKRQDREDEGNQQAVGGAHQQRRRIDCETRRHRKRASGDESHDPGHQGADGEADKDRAEGDNADLNQIAAEDRAAGRAEQFQRGDDAALGIEIGGDAVADANPGHNQGGEADKSKELAQPLDEAARSRRAIGAILDLETLVAEALGQLLRGRRHIGARRKLDPIGAGVEAARLHEAGRLKPRAIDQSGRAERETLPHPVRLLGYEADDGEAGIADPQAVTNAERKPVGKLRPDRDLIADGPRLEGAALEPEVPVKRIGAVDSLQLNEDALGAVEARGHRPHAGDVADCAEGAEGSDLLRRRGALRHADLNVSAQDRLATLGQARDDRRGERADTRQGGDAEEQADGEQPQAREAAAQIADGEAEGKGKAGANPVRHCAASRVRLSVTMRPSCISSTRSQRVARAGSWVMTRRVAPVSRWRAKSRSRIALPVAASRLPVGSSAKRISGRGAIARAIATRCCSPPESWAG